MTRVLSSVVYGGTVTDPAVFAGVLLLLGSTALLATYLLVQRPPALRHE